MLSRICDKLKIKHCFITGEESTNEKRESELAFQKDNTTMVVIANASAGGVGINLTAASHSIVYSRSFSLAHALQSEARNHRGGSEIHKKIVKIDLAIRESLDEQVMQALNNKHQISVDILDIVKKEEV
jgi:SNF2 family DNA or RNA helicase